jgi:hypothetical protein
MSGTEPPASPRVPGQTSVGRTALPEVLQRVPVLARDKLAARFGPIEWILLAILIAVPVTRMWQFASPSFFFSSDIAHFYWAHTGGVDWSYAFGSANGHLAPAYRLTYLALDRVAPMNYEVALGILVACHAVSAVLLQRILTLVFGRVWWTYALALAWALSVVYLPAFTWVAAGLHSIPAITATLASIHAYLCWRATGRRGWLVWSLASMVIGLGFYTKALLIPVYLILMRILVLDPGVRLRDSLRSVRDEWRVWLAYAIIGAVYLLVYSLGDYSGVESGATVGEIVRYLRVFWFEGFWPMVFGVRVPQFGQEAWHGVAIVAAQLALIGLVAWSVARRRAAWRAWAFLLAAVAANALLVVARVGQLGAETIGYYMRYYTEPALLVPLAIAFAFATPRMRARVATVEPVARTAAPEWWSRRPRAMVGRTSIRLPTTGVAIAVLVALAVYVGVTRATADTLSTSQLAEQKQSGRFARAYFDNLRADLAAARRTGVQPSLLDGDVPESVVEPLTNLDPEATEAGVRYSLLSTAVPLFDEHVTFNRPAPPYIVQPDGHLRPTRFVPAAGGSLAELSREGRLRFHEARAERRGGELCVIAEGLSDLEWEPRPHLVGRDWWLRARYRTDPAEPFWVQNNPGVGWADEGPKLPAMSSPGTAFVGLSELPEAVPTNAGVRLGVPPFGRLCLRSLEIGYFDPPVQSANEGG